MAWYLIVAIVIAYVLIWVFITAYASKDEYPLTAEKRVTFLITGFFWPIWIALSIPYSLYKWLLEKL